MPDIGCMPSRGCRPDIGCKYGVDVGPRASWAPWAPWGPLGPKSKLGFDQGALPSANTSPEIRLLGGWGDTSGVRVGATARLLPTGSNQSLSTQNFSLWLANSSFEANCMLHSKHSRPFPDIVCADTTAAGAQRTQVQARPCCQVHSHTRCTPEVRKRGPTTHRSTRPWAPCSTTHCPMTTARMPKRGGGLSHFVQNQQQQTF